MCSSFSRRESLKGCRCLGFYNQYSASLQHTVTAKCSKDSYTLDSLRPNQWVTVAFSQDDCRSFFKDILPLVIVIRGKSETSLRATVK